MDLTQRLKGKTAVVTAAGQGIGRAIAERFLAEGARVIASDLDGGLLADLEEAETHTLDATDEAAVAAHFAPIERIDILVPAAGFVHQGTVEECSLADWRRTQTVTLESTFLVIRAGLPAMKTHGGSIITIASVVGALKGLPKRAAYGAAKGGVQGLMKSVAADYVTHGIRCNAICPGTVDTPSLRARIGELAEQMGSEEAALEFFMQRQPTGRFGTPAEIAGLCAFLASDDGTLVNGQSIGVDGGISI